MHFSVPKGTLAGPHSLPGTELVVKVVKASSELNTVKVDLLCTEGFVCQSVSLTGTEEVVLSTGHAIMIQVHGCYGVSTVSILPVGEVKKVVKPTAKTEEKTESVKEDEVPVVTDPVVTDPVVEPPVEDTATEEDTDPDTETTEDSA